MGTSTATTTTVRRFVDPDDLICPGCGDRAIGVPPAFWQVREDLPVAQFSHPDRTAVCRTVAGRVAEPVEVTRGERWTDHSSDGATLEGAWAAKRSRHPEVPVVVMMLGTGSIGAAGGGVAARAFGALRWAGPAGGGTGRARGGGAP